MFRHANTFVPRNGRELVAGIVARISGCPNQKELSLEDQIDHGKEVVADVAGDYDGPVVYRVVSTKGKGERLDRPELSEIEAMLRTRELDLLVVEDLGRLVRGAEAVRLCGIAVDHGTRVIAPNDCIDTAEQSWEEDVIAACRDHVGHNAHSSRRLKHKLMNRFQKFGGAMARPIYGYIVPDNAQTYADWIKDDKATLIYEEWFKRLRQLPNCSAVADWLNANRVPTGPYCRRKTWDGKMVRRVTANPLLKGMPWRGSKHSVKHHETGRRVSVKNPKGPVYQDFPHLAHVDPALWDEVNALLQSRNDGLGRKPINGADPRAGVSRKRTIWPGQHVRCGICKRLYYWGGHGQAEHMMCSGSHDYLCWNGATFDGFEAANRLLEAILSKIEELPDFDQGFMDKVKARTEGRRSTRADDLQRVQAELKDVNVQMENISDAIARLGLNEVLEQKLNQLMARRESLHALIARMKQDPPNDFVVPTIAEIKRRAREKIQELAADTPEFGVLMRKLVPTLEVYPYRSCDGGAVVLRANALLDLTSVSGLADLADEAGEVLRTEITVDLFKTPQRIAFREDVVNLRAKGKTEKEVAAVLRITKTAAQKAAALHRLMERKGLTDAYIAVTEASANDTKIRRHQHPRYHFEPLSPDSAS